MLAKRLLVFMEPNVRSQFLFLTLKLKKRNTILENEAYMVDFYYFMGTNWCLLAYKVLEFTELHPSVFRLKPYVKKGYVPKRILTTYINKHIK